MDTNSNVTSTADLLKRSRKVAKTVSKNQHQVVDKSTIVTQDTKISDVYNETSDVKDTEIIAETQGGIFGDYEYKSKKDVGYLLAEAEQGGQGVTTLYLRKVTPEGNLKAQPDVNALETQADQAQDAYKKFQKTTGNAYQGFATTREASEETKLQFYSVTSAVAVLAVGLATIG
ncbi:hypothetical protein [Acinetobacter bereziniae]|uniref:Uncharacterized protein n=1 Tax=Acinetobacter bereziniae NIPH 3 TaxID=1217651 RepID=N8YGK1_ACIBZ|nr:hypothetical protein [Acinetobacter bereziniae]ENV20394.1 hypothetical protein F963_03679 [Acinetobacter bereziniae NIPH 3]